jgi:membrane-bound lytic murein transglycosylase D
MKKGILLLIVVFSIKIQAQNIPNAPKTVGFAGINVQFDEGARDIVQMDIKALLANRKYWEAKLDRCLVYFPIIEGILIDNEIPTDFKYLPVQESSLMPDAVSSSNAVGFWQFKKETALDFGLRVDDQTDERKNIVSSSQAATKYLKSNYKLFNNWVSTLYSYYLGAGAVSRNIPVEWNYAREIKLTKDTDRYILRFFAHKIAIEATINRYHTPNPISLLEYPQAGGRTIDNIARELDIDAVALKSYNRWFSTDEIPSDKDYTAVIPVNSNFSESVRVKIASRRRAGQRADFTKTDIGFPVLTQADGVASKDNPGIFYIINGLPGILAVNDDTPAILAKKGKVSFSSFLRYNDMGEEDNTLPGSVYYLARKHRKAAVPFHTVREGETLWQISEIYGIRLHHLLRKNRIDNRTQKLQTGRILWLIDKRPRSRPIEVVSDSKGDLFPTPNSVEAPAKKSPPRPGVEGAKTDIPQTPSERKVYRPKIADPAPTDNTSDPKMGVEVTLDDKKPTTDKTTTKSRRAPWFNPGGESKTNSKTKANDETGSESKIVIKDDEPEAPKKSTPVAAEKKPETKTPTPTVEKKTEPKPTQTSPPVAKQSTDNKEENIAHTVEAGQTYFSIARMYDVSVKDIYFWNNLTENSKLQAGQKLVIKPVGNTVQQQPQPNEPAKVTEANTTTTHTVAQGETAFGISQKYGLTVKQLYELNNLGENAKVQIGQKLIVKATMAAPSAVPNTDEFVIHTVVQGDTMFSIAQKYGVKVDQVREWNGMTDLGVKLGQQLKIKKQK